MKLPQKLVIRRVEGHSMFPNLRHSQVVLAVKTKNFSVGDVVIANVKNMEVVKKITDLRSSSWYLSGNSPKHDIGWVETQQIIAKVIFPRRK